ARRLVELSFPSRVFFCNSGAEANESAIKLARKWGTRHREGAFEIITTTGSFHGRTLATVTAGGQHKYSDPFKPLPDGFVHVAYNDIGAIESATSAKTVAVLLEPVMGEIGVIPASPGYLKHVREWCDRHNLLLILDEVQTGLGHRIDAGLRVRGRKGEGLPASVFGGGAHRQRGRRSLGPPRPAFDRQRAGDRSRARDHAESLRMTATKASRHSAILDLVNRGSVHTQQDIAAALARRGLRATQATISRDIQELGLVRAVNGYRSSA